MYRDVRLVWRVDIDASSGHMMWRRFVRVGSLGARKRNIPRDSASYASEGLGAMRTPSSANVCDEAIVPKTVLVYVDAWCMRKLIEFIVHHFVREQVQVEAA